MASLIKVGIVSTMKGPEFTLESWILWHTSIGIEHFYIFFDDPKDEAIAIAEKYSSLISVRFHILDCTAQPVTIINLAD